MIYALAEAQSTQRFSFEQSTDKADDAKGHEFFRHISHKNGFKVPVLSLKNPADSVNPVENDFFDGDNYRSHQDLYSRNDICFQTKESVSIRANPRLSVFHCQ